MSYHLADSKFAFLSNFSSANFSYISTRMKLQKQWRKLQCIVLDEIRLQVEQLARKIDEDIAN